MHQKMPPTRLLPRQTRVIHAAEGVRFRVVSGRLWLTQPNVAQDLFLGPGDCIDLLRDWVVISADVSTGTPHGAESNGAGYSSYELQPLFSAEPKAGPRLLLGAALAWVKARVGGRSKALVSAPQL